MMSAVVRTFSGGSVVCCCCRYCSGRGCGRCSLLSKSITLMNGMQSSPRSFLYSSICGQDALLFYPSMSSRWLMVAVLDVIDLDVEVAVATVCARCLLVVLLLDVSFQGAISCFLSSSACW